MSNLLLPARLQHKAIPSDEGCLLWTGATGGGKTHRYAVAQLDGKLQLVHRWLYEQAHGPVGAGVHVHHKCRVPLCLNLEHLEALPIREHIGQWHRDKTHCPYGHPYSVANTYRRRDGSRQCRECGRLRAKARKSSAR